MNFNEFLNEKVTVLDNRYVRSHGKAPKGWGKWMFYYDEKGNDFANYGMVKDQNNNVTKFFQERSGKRKKKKHKH